MEFERRIAEFCTAQDELIELERAAEIEETLVAARTLSAKALERRGLCLLRLKIVEEGPGVGGRRVLELTPSSGDAFVEHRFQAGDLARLSAQTDGGKSTGLRGVVTRLRRDRLALVLDDPMGEPPPGPLRLDRVMNETTYERMRDAIAALRSGKLTVSRGLREVLFGKRAVEQRKMDEPSFRTHLDASQQDAVRLALSADPIALVHGPPGTGKTTTLVELILQATERREWVLACAPSNVAVDNLVERLSAAGLSVVRLGHPARLLPSVLENSLDHIVRRSEGAKMVNELRRDLDQLHRSRKRARSWEKKRQLTSEIREFTRGLREMERWAIRQAIESAQVVLTTLTGAADSLLREMNFDLAVVDEAAQALEAATWIPLLKAKRAVLAGDHLQLPPIVRSRKAEHAGLSVTLFDRLQAELGDDATRMLSVQYRMHAAIMGWSSKALYDGRLKADASVHAHVLADLGGVRDDELTRTPIIMIDTAGCDFEESEEGDSRANTGEADVVARHIADLVEHGVSAKNIAVITPYRAQVKLLRRKLETVHPDLEVGTVDGFQGREKEAVIISAVRSNPRRTVGFLAERRRMNVAVTRARRHVAIVADSATVSSDSFLASLVEYCQKHGLYRSAWE